MGWFSIYEQVGHILTFGCCMKVNKKVVFLQFDPIFPFISNEKVVAVSDSRTINRKHNYTWSTLVAKNRILPPEVIKLPSLSQITEGESCDEDETVQVSSVVDSRGDFAWLMVTLTDNGSLTRTSNSPTLSLLFGLSPLRKHR